MADLMTVDYLTALGYDTTSSSASSAATGTRTTEDHYLRDELSRDGLVDPGFVYEADLEAVAAADPDLILLPFDQIDGIRSSGRSCAIGPLVAVPMSEETARSALRRTASFQDWRGTAARLRRAPRPRRRGEGLHRGDGGDAGRPPRQEHADTIATTPVARPEHVGARRHHPLSADLAALGAILFDGLGFRSAAHLDEASPTEWGTIEISRRTPPSWTATALPRSQAGPRGRSTSWSRLSMTLERQVSSSATVERAGRQKPRIIDIDTRSRV